MSKLLLVIDMQNDFIDGVLGNAECQAIVPKVIARMKQAHEDGWKILCTADTHEQDYLQTGEGTRLPVAHCIRGTHGAELIEDIKLLERTFSAQTFLPEHPYEKPAFGSSALSRTLKAYDFDEIEIVGVCTDICVLSNAIILRSDHPDIALSVNASACAGVTPQSHRIALEAMRGCQITIREQ